jgi:hypothetical protein
MNFYIIIILSLGLVFIGIFLYKLSTVLHPKYPVQDIRLPDSLKDLSPRKTASYMMQLVISGYFKNHRLHNNAQEYDDDSFLRSYTAFLNKDKNITALHGIKESYQNV